MGDYVVVVVVVANSIIPRCYDYLITFCTHTRADSFMHYVCIEDAILVEYNYLISSNTSSSSGTSNGCIVKGTHTTR